MNKTLGKFIFFGSIVAIVTGVILIFKKDGDGDEEGDKSNKLNFKVLLKNLGGNAKEDNGSVSVMFNGNKNSARFYNNSRFVIFSGTNELVKGLYENGGFTMTPDGGKMVNNPSVYTNLNLLAK